MKKEKSGLLLVSLVKYLIRAEIETLWSFLRVLSGFQYPPAAIISFPSPAPNSFHTLRGRGLEVVLQNPLVSLAEFYIQGFSYLPQVTLIPFPTWFVLEYHFSLVLKVGWYSYNLPSSLGSLPNRSKDWVWKQRKNLICDFWGVRVWLVIADRCLEQKAGDWSFPWEKTTLFG